MTEKEQNEVPKSIKKAEDEITKHAKDGCRHCHGRGITGWMILGKTKSPIICRCVSKAIAAKVKREIAERERANAKA